MIEFISKIISMKGLQIKIIHVFGLLFIWGVPIFSQVDTFSTTNTYLIDARISKFPRVGLTCRYFENPKSNLDYGLLWIPIDIGKYKRVFENFTPGDQYTHTSDPYYYFSSGLGFFLDYNQFNNYQLGSKLMVLIARDFGIVFKPAISGHWVLSNKKNQSFLLGTSIGYTFFPGKYVQGLPEDCREYKDGINGFFINIDIGYRDNSKNLSAKTIKPVTIVLGLLGTALTILICLAPSH